MPTKNEPNIYREIGLATHFIDTEDNWIKYNPRTIPGMFYISKNENSESSFKIGDGRLWNEIDKFTLDRGGVPVGTMIFCLTINAPYSYIPLNGALLDRNEFSELFAFASTSGMYIEDDLWNSDILYHGFFSSGDKTSTFRLPLIDDIVIEAWSTSTGNNPGRNAGSYQRGTLIGTDYFYGVNQASPYMSFFNYGLSIKNGMTTNDCPQDVITDTLVANDIEYQSKIAEAIYERQDELIHPEESDLMDAISLDLPKFKNNYEFNSPQTGCIFPSNTVYSNTRIIGMMRQESIAYPVYIKYTKY